MSTLSRAESPKSALFHCSWSALLDPSQAIGSEELLTHLPVLLAVLPYPYPHLPTPVYSFIHRSLHPAASILICTCVLPVYLSTCVCIHPCLLSILYPYSGLSSSSLVS